LPVFQSLRPAAISGSFDCEKKPMDYISPEEKTKLAQQLRDCISQRKVLSERIATARALGDLKENGDYHAAREDQGLNEAKIRQLESRLSSAVVADSHDMPTDIVFLGATVKLRDVESEDTELYKLVGETTGNFDADYVEVTPTSPMGEALMKARLGEVVRVNLRRGERRFEIVEINTG
jgi:transcription elongation factor GreA